MLNTKKGITDSQQELLIEVNQHNQVIGPIARGVAHHSPGKFYRTIFVLVRNKDNQIFVQKRSATKDLFPNCWDLSVGGHVPFGTTYLDTAIRELQEELGVTATKEDVQFLQEVLVKMPSSNEFFHVFSYDLKPTDTVIVNSEEVAQTRWMSIDEIQSSIKYKTFEWYPRPVQVIQSLYS